MNSDLLQKELMEFGIIASGILLIGILISFSSTYFALNKYIWIKSSYMKVMEEEKHGLKKNYILFSGCLVVLLGFVLMSGGGSDDPNVFNEEELFSFRRITLAPFLVILGYGIVLYGIMKKN